MRTKVQRRCWKEGPRLGPRWQLRTELGTEGSGVGECARHGTSTDLRSRVGKTVIPRETDAG